MCCATLIKEYQLTARKDHECMAYPFVWNCVGSEALKFSELREVIRMRKQKGIILKGQKYIKQAVAKDSEIYTFKADPAMHKICSRLNLYCEC